MDKVSGQRVTVKKLFDGSGMKCSMCGKLGHTLSFCPSRVTTPLSADRSPFVDALVNSARVRLDIYQGSTWEQVWERFLVEGTRLNMGNPWRSEVRPEFHLKKNLGFWKALGSDRTVMSWIGYGVDVNFASTPSPVQFANNKLTLARHESFIDEEIRKHVKDGLARMVEGNEVVLVHPLLVVENAAGKLRLCDDMRWSNAFQASPSFTMQSLEKDIPELVQPGDVLFTRDLAKAYYKVMMAPRARRFQNRSWKGSFYQMICLLFGMCNAPFVFTKICRPIVRFFGASLVKLMNFIDDWLLSAKPTEIERLRQFFENVLTTLGWTFNDKGEEGTSVVFLGFVLDAVKREFIVPEAKIAKTKGKLAKVAEAETKSGLVKTDMLLSLLGQIGSMRLAIPGVSCWSRELYSPWQGLAPQVSPPVLCRVSKDMLEEIQMLDFLLSHRNGAPFMSKVLELDLFCDASEVGWGAFILQTDVSGTFTADLIGKSSTFRELSGLLACLDCPMIVTWVKGKTIRINMDSAPAIANLIKGGGPVRELCRLVKALDRCFHSLSVTPVFRWLKRDTMEMRKADALSKELTYSMEKESLRVLEEAFQCEVLCPQYNAIPNVLAEIIAKGRVCLLVIPVWEAKSWWPSVVSSARALMDLTPCRLRFDVGRTTPAWQFKLAYFY